MPRRMTYDRWLVFITLMLVASGLLMVGSSSNYVAMHYSNDPSAFLVRHAVHLLLGFVVFGGMLYLSYRSLDQRALVLGMLGSCLVLLVIVLMMPPIGGARRWLAFGPLTVQPSEFAKLATVVFMAYVLSRKQDSVNAVRSVAAPCLGVVGTLGFLVWIEPDLGSAFVMASVAGVMLFAAGLRWRYLLGLAAIGSVGLLASFLFWPFRILRLLIFLDPSRDPLGAGFQLNQSLIAIGKGGLTGAGLGQGQQKAFYVPAAHTDFIFSIIGEEFGLVGTGLLLVAFLLLFWRGMRAAARAPDRFGFFLALGLTHLIALQALLNMAVCVGLLPTKGLTLPLISYGGSSLLASMCAMGLLVNVSQHSS